MIFKFKLLGPVFRQYFILIVGNLSFLQIGMDVGWLSPVLAKLRDGNQTTLTHPLSGDEASWIASITALSGFIAIIFIGYLMDNAGRARTILLAFIPRLAACLLYLLATDTWMLMAGRFLCGFSLSVMMSVVPVYASEIASRDKRGALGTLSQFLSAVGTLIMLCTGPFVSYLTITIVFTSVNILLFIPQLFLPESPYFLYSKGDSEKCLQLLIFLRGSTELANEEIQEYAATADMAISKRAMLNDKTLLKTLGKTLFLAFGFQMVGYNAIIVYLQTIFESTNSKVSSEASSVVVGLIQLFACLCTIFLTDRFGRKPILGINLTGMAIGLIGLGVFFKVTEDNAEISAALNYLPVVSLVLVVFCFNSGLGSITWMLTAELYDGPSRALGVTSSIQMTTAFIFIMVKWFPSVVTAIGAAATYWCLGGNCLILCLFIVFCLPETKGRTFLEIQQALGRNSSRRKSLQ